MNNFQGWVCYTQEDGLAVAPKEKMEKIIVVDKKGKRYSTDEA
jgi:hypothetical protein